MNKDFISQILEKIGYISAFAVAFSQYFLKDYFSVFFQPDIKMYYASSMAALIISILIIIAVFSNKYLISLKTYFSKKKKDKYFASLRQQKQPDQQNEYVPEPRSFTLKQVAFVLILFSMAMFFVFIYYENLLIRSMSYIGFIISVVGSISIFATGLYLENDWQQREKNKKELLLNKLKEYFAGDIQISTSWTDNTNLVQPLRRMIVSRSSKKYNVTVDANDPDKFFVIEEINQ